MSAREMCLLQKCACRAASIHCVLRLTTVFLLLWVMGSLGCAPAPADTQFRGIRWDGPVAPAEISRGPWSYDNTPGEVLRTEHYEIYTTIEDRDLRTQLAQVMEGAHAQYRKLAPGIPHTDAPLLCFVFGKRSQWESFTRANTGADSAIYLQINRGGFTIRDWYVAYDIGETATLSVAAHEGWHQYVARNFRGRLPPFLEEGTSCLFERIRWEKVKGSDVQVPRWNLSANPPRQQSLRNTIDNNRQYPLAQLYRLHAGLVVGQLGGKIEAFYSQSWAFARFLLEAEDGRYRPAFEKLLTDAASGEIVDPSGSHRRAGLPWQPRSVQPMLEHYLGEPTEVTEKKFQQFMRKVASYY
jgi:hypothetical protein